MQILINGLISGAAIALLATAFQIVYLPTRVFFLGLAGIYAAAPFFAYGVLRSGGAWPIAVAVALGACVILSLLCEWLNHARLARRQASDGTHLVSSLGIYIIIVQLVGMIWGNGAKALRTGLDSSTQFLGVIVTGPQWVTLGVSAVIIAVFVLFLTRADLGLRLRALADNQVQFSLLGHNVDRHRLLAFAISGFLAAGSSLAVSYDVGFDPHVGLDALLLSIAAVIIGGRDSFLGPALAGILLGVVRSGVIWFLSAQWEDAVTFTLLILFLFLRPQGLLGKKRRLEVQV